MINFQGAGGADVIKFNGNGTIGSTGKILGNAGGDIITLSATKFGGSEGLTIGGGAGNDTIAMDEFGSAGSGAFVVGGGGPTPSSSTTTTLALPDLHSLPDVVWER